MTTQRWEESEKRREDTRRSENRKHQKEEGEHPQKGRPVADQYIFRVICSSGGSKTKLVKTAGAEPSREMRNEKLQTAVARNKFGSQMLSN